MHDCELRPFGEPMPCKPYSHFEMGCYTCECNGDGVAECDAKDCDFNLNGKDRPPEFNEFFSDKETDEIIQYYNTHKKLPKYCPKPNSQAQYRTCEPGTSWISSCHKCECNELGKHECIKIDGCKLDYDSYGNPGRCKPNSKFYPKTNSVPCGECSCDDEGIAHCPSAEQKN
ncbi:hypothetical protein PYW07_006573 [Mythimna separata]|uniref:Uncharacterized protein n=1 Tax=Mythimna separata TaxID=271217 RepID=A0AAD7YTV3_MYTSE|nr:hypothetical protein PYW07_006573 [Mythimna separata]